MSSLAELRKRLEARRLEMEQAIVTRIFAVAEPRGTEEAHYVDGLRSAATAALDYGLESIELGPQRSGSPPPILLAQARMAARSGVGLETVLRRYSAGHMLLVDFLISETSRKPRLDKMTLQKALRSLAALFDQLIAAVGKEYEREASEALIRPVEQRRTAMVQKLLAGELLDASELAYPTEAFHIGIVAVGPGAEEAVRAVACRASSRLLMVSRGEGGIWAWLGRRRPLPAVEFERHLRQGTVEELCLAYGEPAWGLAGWRLSHQQARAAIPVALKSPKRVLRYADVAVLAAVLNDEILTESIRQLYLAPLAGDRDEGHVSRETLRAYFRANQRVTSTAAAMKLTRQTVRRRLSRIEDQLGQPIERCSLELELALRVEDLLTAVPSAHLVSARGGNWERRPSEK